VFIPGEKSMNNRILIIGDILAIALITLIGFTSHGEADISFLPRVAAIYFPLTISWFLLAPWYGLFQEEIVHNARQLWRPVLAALFAAPLATVLRGLILDAPIIPIFAVVLSATSAFGMALWRAIYLFIAPKV